MERNERWPRHISIRGQRWKVRLVGKHELSGKPGHKGQAEYFSPPVREIRVWKGLSGKARWVALWHEILHIAFYFANGESGTPITIEEQIVYALEEPLFEILNRNFGIGPNLQ